MKIQRVAIQAYRSLYDVSLLPRDLTVLVGANNSGKSNLLDALDFIGEVHRHGVEVATVRKGGFENIAHRRARRTRKPITFEVEAAVHRDDLEQRMPRRRSTAARRQEAKLFDADAYRAPDIVMRHTFSLKATNQRLGTDFIVDREELHIAGSNSERGNTFSVIRRGSELEFEPAVSRQPAPNRKKTAGSEESEFYPLDDPDFQEFASRNIQPTELAIGLLSYSPLVSVFQSGLARSKIYHLSPHECRQPGVSTPNADIEPHGGNLPALAANIARTYPDSWGRVIKSMRRLVPGLQDIRTDFTHDRRLTLEFVEAGAGRPWTSEDVSDGTIQSLALFLALFDPRSAMTLIEEPENSVHPWIIRSFVDACREVASKQVILTTHSPVLMNYLEPDDVFVVWRSDGRTQISPLTSVDETARATWEDGLASIFDLIDSGVVEQAIPQGFA